MSDNAIFAVGVLLVALFGVIGWFVCQAFERAFDLEDKQ